MTGEHHPAGDIPATPDASRRIRVVVVNWNGGTRTITCLRSVLDADVPEGCTVEVVLVDNASHDGIVGRVRAELPGVRVIENAANLGFAGGVNSALRDLAASGNDDLDAVALVNNDAIVEPDWLPPLLATLDSAPDIGAACPKILLTDRYLDLTITTDATPRGALDARPLGVRVSAIRIGDDDAWTRTRFVRGFHGPESGPPPEAHYQWTGAEALLRIPVDDDHPLPALELRLAADTPRTVTLASGSASKVHDVGPEPAWYPAALDGTPVDLVNNVGTTLARDAYGADRGWLEIDGGQFDEPDDVFAWCGGAVLLGADYLRQVGLFDERLFLYSEDLELSWRGRARGWRYRTAPDSVVRHEHAAASGEHSDTKTFYDERNHLLVVTRHGDRRLVTRTLVRYLLVTASYTRRDVVAPLIERRPVTMSALRTRLRALGGYARLAPAMLAARPKR